MRGNEINNSIFPNDWDTIKFGDCFDIIPNNTLSRASLNYDEGKVKNIHYGDILVKFSSILDCSTEEIPYVNETEVSHCSCYVLKDGDIIIADTAEDSIVGKVIEVINIGEQRIVSGLHTIPCRPKNKDRFSPRWLGYYMNHHSYHNQLLPFITGIKVSSISKKAISNTVIAIPPLPEQTAIATALSDMDALIDGLRRLITKKKNIRQGAMQELLTGERRLPGVEGEWVEQPLSKHGIFIRGVSYNPTTDIHSYDSDYVKYLLRANNIIDGQLNLSDVIYVDEQRVSGNQLLQHGDIVIAMSSGSLIAIGKNAQYKSDSNKFCVGAFCAIYRSDVSDYIFHVLQSSMFREKLKNILAGTSINNLNGNELGKMKFMFPQDKAEWDAICQVLDDINEEISYLESKLQKYENIKSGMMDKLLTGQIRLV